MCGRGTLRYEGGEEGRRIHPSLSSSREEDGATGLHNGEEGGEESLQDRGYPRVLGGEGERVAFYWQVIEIGLHGTRSIRFSKI